MSNTFKMPQATAELSVNGPGMRNPVYFKQLKILDGGIHSLYSVEAIREVLEQAALECESRQTTGTGSVAILNGAADAIRAMKEQI